MKVTLNSINGQMYCGQIEIQHEETVSLLTELKCQILLPIPLKLG